MNEPFERERALFSAARGLPLAERAAYLDEACRGDAVLRQRVEELLQAGEEAQGFLQEPAPGAQRSEAAAAASPLVLNPAAPGEKAGDRIGRYKLLQQIGEGGCGLVYMAEQEEPVRRRVALKVIKLGMDTKSVIARFEAERQALAMMDHPNIAKVLDAGSTETGRPYFVMELVRGIKITDYCDEHNLSTKERLELFMQVCHAVQHAHQKGIIHRDLKPSNILVGSNDGVSVPKVIDFGIAKATQGRLTDQTLFTAFEQFIGTPAYMSPEQAELTMQDVDTRTDIYSLGVLLYELLTGRTPFSTQELLSCGLDAMRRTIREQEPVRPSTKLSTLLEGELTTTARHRRTEAPKLVHLLRGDLDWIVMKCLEKERTRRYETANGLAMDVGRHLSWEPVVACPPSRLYEFQKTVRRHKFGFAAAGAVMAALMIGLVVSTWLLVAEKAARRRAVIAEQKARTEAAKSQQVAGLLKKMLRGVGPSRALGRDTTMLREIVDKTAESVGKELTNQAEVEVEVLLTLGEAYFELGLYEQMEAMARQSLQVARSGLGEENRSVAISLMDLGDARFYLGQFVEAESLYREALAKERNLFGNENLDVATSLDHLAEALNYQGKLGEAEATLREALAIRRKLSGDQDPDAAATLSSLAHVLWEEGKLADVETLDGDILRTNSSGGTNLATARSLVYLAKLRSEQDRDSEAEAALREALAIQTKLLGKEHPDAVNTLNELGILLRGEGKLAQAEDVFRDVLAMQRNVLGDKHPEAESWTFNLAAVLRQEGKLGELETVYRESLAKQRKLFGDDHPDVAASLKELANLLVDEGKVGDAEALCRGELAPLQARLDALARNDEKRSEMAVRVGHWQWHLATVLTKAGRSGQAEPVLREALRLFQQTSGDFPSQLFLRQEQASTRRQLAEALINLGRVDEAETEERAAIALYSGLKAAAPTNAFFVREEAYTAWTLAKMLEGAGRRSAAAIQYREAITFHRTASAAFPDDTELKERLVRLLDEKGTFAGIEGAYRLAEAQYRKNAEGGDLRQLNALAWFLATCPDPAVRNGQAAVDLAKQTVAASNRREENFLDTLAAAYAAIGQFTEAVRTEKEAMKLLSTDPSENAKEFAARLKLYESGSPYLQSGE